MTVAGSGTPPHPEIDPITFEVLNNAFRSIVDEMGALHAVGGLLARGQRGARLQRHDLPRRRRPRDVGHAPTSPPTSAPSPTPSRACWSGSACRPEEYFEPGDLVVVNDAYIGGTHNNDVRVVMPVFHEGEIIAFVQNSAHWTDIGGRRARAPSTPTPAARTARG